MEESVGGDCLAGLSGIHDFRRIRRSFLVFAMGGGMRAPSALQETPR
jgi:hypothetical protein